MESHDSLGVYLGLALGDVRGLEEAVGDDRWSSLAVSPPESRRNRGLRR